MTPGKRPRAWDCPWCGSRAMVRVLQRGPWRVYAHKQVGGPDHGQWCPGTQFDLSKGAIRSKMRRWKTRPRRELTLADWTRVMERNETEVQVWNRTRRCWHWVRRPGTTKRQTHVPWSFFLREVFL